MRFVSLCVVTSLCSPMVLCAQGGSPCTPAHEVDLGAVVRGSFGVVMHADEVRGVGPDYSARFLADGVHFTPLLAAQTAVRTQVHWRTDSVRRGDEAVWIRGNAVPPEPHANTVRYALAAGLDEVYDVRRDGIEQSFVFATKPAGHGDLVVRCSVATDLPSTADGGGVLWALPGADGVRLGAVTGIDANGAKVAGQVRVIGAAFELSLPASFVDSAQYPLVLDPLVGTAFTMVSSANLSVDDPSAAFDDSTNRYLVVWSVLNTVRELRGQLVDTTGAPVGSSLLFDASVSAPLYTHSVGLGRQAVANINSVNRFLVAWSSHDVFGGANGYALEAVAVNASNGAISGSTPVYSAGLPSLQVDSYALAGNRTASGTNSDVAWVLLEAGGLRAIAMQVPATGAPLVGTSTSIGSARGLAITQDGGSLPRWLACWTEATSLSAPPTVVRAQPLGGSGPCGAPLLLFTAAAGDGLGEIACATANGANFLVAWSNTLGGANDLQVTSLTFGGICSGLTATQGPVTTLPTAAGLQDQPALAHAAGKYVMAWRERATATSPGRVHVQGLHPTTGAPAGANLPVDGPTILSQDLPNLASRWSGGDAASDEALLVWTTGSLRARRFESFGSGSVTSLGGACGSSGLNDFATYSGLPTLGTTFSIELLAPTAPVLALIVGFSQSPLACGPCTIVPSPDLLLGGGGPVMVNVPLDANLIGFSLYTQWLQWRPSGCSLLPDFGFSNTLRFTIAE